MKVNLKQLVLEAVDIVELIEGYNIELRKKGANHLGLCPFHDEKSPSFTVHPVKQICKCFGCGQGGNAIKFISIKEGLEWKEALLFLAHKYNIATGKHDTGVPEWPELPKAKYEGRSLTKEELEHWQGLGAEEQAGGIWLVNHKDKMTDFELHTLGSVRNYETKKETTFITQSTVDFYGLKALQNYVRVKTDAKGNPRAHVFHSTDEFPQYCWNAVKGPKKGYKPLEVATDPDTGKQLRTDKGKPVKGVVHLVMDPIKSNYLFGLEAVRASVKKEQNKREDSLNEGNYEYAPNPDVFYCKGNESQVKLKKLVIASGGSDGLMIKQSGYHAIWPNSESWNLDYSTYRELSALALNIYICYDADATGIRQAAKICMEHWEVKWIQLPEYLKWKKDQRYGKPCKDARDQIYYFNNFKSLIEGSHSLKPYDKEWNNQRSRYDYEFNQTQAFGLMQAAGFGIYLTQESKDKHFIVKVNGSRVKKLEKPHEARTIFIEELIKPRNYYNGENKVQILNMFYRSKGDFSFGSFANLKPLALDFKKYTPHAQYFCFENQTVEVTKLGIRFLQPQQMQKHVWESQLLPLETGGHTKWKSHYKLTDASFFKQAPFTITKDEDGAWQLEIHDQKCEFLKYLWSTSRVHWKKETKGYPEYRESGLTREEAQEQVDHFVNKVYVVGYSLHQNKNPNRPWMIVGVDHDNPDPDSAEGGRGKSMLPDYFLPPFLKKEFVDGRDPKNIEGSHWNANLSVNTDLLFIDDAAPNFPYTKFYNYASGSWIANPKGVNNFTISFEDAGKIWINTNYGLANIQGSTLRRMLILAFSDWYHSNDKGIYLEERKVGGEEERSFPMDFSYMEWQRFYRSKFYCVAFYLNHNKINAPMDDIFSRSFLQQVPRTLRMWLDNFMEDKFNMLLNKAELYQEFSKGNAMLKYNDAVFYDKVQKWCGAKGYEYNPREQCNDRGKYIKKVPEWPELSSFDNKQKTCIYIKFEKPEEPETSEDESGIDEIEEILNQ